jgi:uncharacterized membrane protein YidH (DUF202 family)
MKKSDPETKPTFLQLLGSVLAAIGGVQSKKNLRRDFNSNSAWKIAGIGIAVTIIFVLLIVFAAQYAAS